MKKGGAKMQSDAESDARAAEQSEAAAINKDVEPTRLAVSASQQVQKLRESVERDSATVR